LCTVVPLSMLQPLGLLYLIPLFGLSFTAMAFITRLVMPSDLRFALEFARNKLSGSRAKRSATDS
jgi:hypothetical protein